MKQTMFVVTVTMLTQSPASCAMVAHGARVTRSCCTEVRNEKPIYPLAHVPSWLAQRQPYLYQFMQAIVSRALPRLLKEYKLAA